MSRGGSHGLLALLFAAAIPSAVWGQTPPSPVSATVESRAVEALFGVSPEAEDRFDLEAERVGITVATSRVDALFRSTIQVDVFTSGGPFDPDGYLVSIESVDGPVWFERQRVAANDTMSTVLEPGRYSVSLEDVAEGCEVVSTESEPRAGGLPERVAFGVRCDPPASLSVAVSESIAVPDEEASVQLVGTAAQAIPVGSRGDFQGLAPGPNELRLVLPDPIPPITDINFNFPSDTPGGVSLSLNDDPPELVLPDQTVRIGRGGDSLNVTLNIERPIVTGTGPRTVSVRAEGPGAQALTSEVAKVRLAGGEAQTLSPDSVADLGTTDEESIQVVLDLTDFDPTPDGWHLSAGLGAIAVAATDPKSFITPTVGLSLVKGRAQMEWLHLNAQFGYWRSGPSSADPVLPDDPRPPFRNRTIWTWSLGGSVFPQSWDGFGVSASWVEGRETASEEEKYINRSRGVAVGPRFRLLTADPWPSVIFGLDAQYGEADELRAVEPEWGWSLTPMLSLSYVFR